MRNLFYLLVLAVLFTGCVSNSFLSRRYTNFKHLPGQHVREEQAVVHEPPSSAHSTVIHDEEMTFAYAMQNAPPDVIYHDKSIAEPVRAQNIFQKVTTQKNISNKDDNRQLKVKTKSNEKAQAARGPIGTVLKIVLFVVILAILLSIIILVALV